MSGVKSGEYEQFSIEEIIAEIKSEATGGAAPPVRSDAQKQAAEASEPPIKHVAGQKPEVEPKIESKSEPQPRRAAPPKPKPAQTPKPAAAAHEKPLAAAADIDHDVKLAPAAAPPGGARIKPPPESAAQRIVREEAESAEKMANANAGKPLWRTEKKVFEEDKRQDTQEFEIDTAGLPPVEAEEELDEQPRRTLPYDFINVGYSDAAAAVKKLEKHMSSLAARILLMVPLIILSTYMCVCLPLGLPMPFGISYITQPFVYLLVLCVCQVLALIIGADVTAPGLMRMLKLRPTLDSLVLFCGLCALVHTASIIVRPQWGGYLPYPCVSIFICFIALVAKRQRADGLKRAYKVSLLGTVPSAVKALDAGDRIIAVKSDYNAYADMDQLCELDLTERIGEFYAPLAIVASIAFAAVASFGQNRGHTFMWCLSAMSCIAVPGPMLISSSMPMRKLARKIFTSGSSLINYSSASALSKCNAATFTDADIFPTGSVEINGMKIEKAQPIEHVLGYATAMTQEIGGGLARAFSDLARQRYIPSTRAVNIRFFESGGMSAEIDGHHALLGSATFLMRMGVKVTEGVKLQNCLFIAIDGGFAGIFSLKYGVQPQPYAAFRILRSSRTTPLIVTKDVCITQAYIESRFELGAMSTEYPELAERIRLSDHGIGRDSPSLAFLSRDGILPFAEVVSASRKLKKAVIFNLVISFAAAVFGALLMYFLTYNFEVAAAVPHNVLMYIILWLVPAWLGTAIITRL